MKWMCRLSLSVVLMCASRAGAIGWGPTDFLITGAPNFPDRIGVFDQNFAFKGYLDQNFLGVQGMDFDSQGRLVALSGINAEIRVYDPSGAQVGQLNPANSPALVPANDVKVMGNGNYLLGTANSGALAFTPQGELVRQYADGDSRGVLLVPGNRLWSGGNNLTMRIYDIDSAAQVGSFALDQQTRGVSTMQYSFVTDTVLIVDRDRDAGGVFERDLDGILLHQFHVPIAQTTCNGATRGPNQDIFGTSLDPFADVVQWRSDESVVTTRDVFPTGTAAGRILWAGVVPEPGAPLLILASISGRLIMRRPSSLQQSLVATGRSCSI